MLQFLTDWWEFFIANCDKSFQKAHKAKYLPSFSKNSEEQQMPLNNYGLLVGRFDHFDRDDPNHYGNYFHGHIFVNAPHPKNNSEINYRCAVDVKAPNGIVEYIKIRINRRDIASILSLPNDYHQLSSNSSSGAIDYIRSRFIVTPLGCAAIFLTLLRAITGQQRPVFTQNVGGSVLTDLETALMNSRRLYIFGQFFHNVRVMSADEYGMHDIHMNQGDPMPAQGDPDYQNRLNWYNNSGIWQDGGILIEHTNDECEGFFIKFLTQSLNTGLDGHPL